MSPGVPAPLTSAARRDVRLRLHRISEFELGTRRHVFLHKLVVDGIVNVKAFATSADLTGID